LFKGFITYSKEKEGLVGLDEICYMLGNMSHFMISGMSNNLKGSNMSHAKTTTSRFIFADGN